MLVDKSPILERLSYTFMQKREDWDKSLLKVAVPGKSSNAAVDTVMTDDSYSSRQ